MADLILMPDVEAELEVLYSTEPDSAALFDVLFDELVYHKEVLDVLCKPAYHHLFDPPFEIKLFQEMWRRGYNIFTMRVFDEHGSLLPRRVLIGYHAQIDVYYPLAFPNREVAYDTTDTAFADVIHRYAEANIPIYR